HSRGHSLIWRHEHANQGENWQYSHYGLLLNTTRSDRRHRSGDSEPAEGCQENPRDRDASQRSRYFGESTRTQEEGHQRSAGPSRNEGRNEKQDRRPKLLVRERGFSIRGG